MYLLFSSESFYQLLLTFLTIIGSLIVGILTGIYTDSFKKRIVAPKLKLTFEGRSDLSRRDLADNNSKKMYLYDTPNRAVIGDKTIEFRSLYIRILVSNISKRTAYSCRPYLTKIQKESAGGFVTIFNDLLPLQWSYMLDRNFDIPGGTDIFFALAAIDNYHKILQPITQGQPFIYKELMHPEGTYVFSIILTADHIHPLKADVYIVLEPNGDTVDVKDVFMK